MDSESRSPRVQGEKEILELCADLASVGSLSSLTDGQRLIFRERMSHANEKAWRTDLPSDIAALERLHRWVHKVVVPLVNFPRQALADRRISKSRSLYLEGLSDDERPGAPELVPIAEYEAARLSELGAPRLATFLADGRGKRDWRVVIRPFSGEVALEENELEIERGLEDLAWQLVQPGTVFPFTRCKQCGRVFVLSKSSQLYCSPTCAAASNKANRRAKVRENVRRYRERRKRAEK